MLNWRIESYICRTAYFLLLNLRIEGAIEVLNQYWGFENFRPVQKTIIQEILVRKKVIGILPTGGGKSICFQVPGMLMEGITIVISPLISLIDDQVSALNNRGIKALALHSKLSQRNYFIEIDNVLNGKYKFVYLSPEKLLSQHFQSILTSLPVSMFAIDEAHCVSMWGFDFRPSYRKLKDSLALFPNALVIALTASATKQVIKDIGNELGLKEAKLIRASLLRKNLTYAVLYEESIGAKLLEMCNKVRGSGLIYTRSRKETVELSRLLSENGLSSDYYHAGLTLEERTLKQSKWMDGEIRIMICTSAFGMGIDKSDVRFVFHAGPPENLAYYYQEAGRAGRDRQQAYIGLLFNEDHINRLESAYNMKKVNKEIIKEVYEHLYNYYQIAVGNGKGLSFSFDPNQVIASTSLKSATYFNAINMLKLHERIQFTDTVFSGSKLQIIASPQQLVRLQNENQKLDKIIKVLVRKYSGVYTSMVKIDEKFMAQELNLPLQVIKNYLQRLNELKYVDYAFASGENSILFLQERQKAFVVDTGLIKNYNLQLKEGLAGMQSYLNEQKACRHIQISMYFGLKESMPCGRCDNCKTTKKSSAFKKIFKQTSMDLKVLIQNKENKSQILAEIENNPLQTLVLQDLIERKIVIKDKVRYYWS